MPFGNRFSICYDMVFKQSMVMGFVYQTARFLWDFLVSGASQARNRELINTNKSNQSSHGENPLNPYNDTFRVKIKGRGKIYQNWKTQTSIQGKQVMRVLRVHGSLRRLCLKKLCQTERLEYIPRSNEICSFQYDKIDEY